MNIEHSPIFIVNEIFPKKKNKTFHRNDLTHNAQHFCIMKNHISLENDTISFYYFAFSGTFTSNNVYIVAIHTALWYTQFYFFYLIF